MTEKDIITGVGENTQVLDERIGRKLTEVMTDKITGVELPRL